MSSDLMMETLDTAYGYLDKVIDSFGLFSNLIIEGETGKAANVFIQIIDAFEWIADAFSRTALIHNNAIETQELNDKLPELLEAFENNDYVLMSDILNYEIKPVLEKLDHNRYIN
ncbi:hypothetical protein [Clostridium sp.]